MNEEKRLEIQANALIAEYASLRDEILTAARSRFEFVVIILGFLGLLGAGVGLLIEAHKGSPVTRPLSSALIGVGAVGALVFFGIFRYMYAIRITRAAEHLRCIEHWFQDTLGGGPEWEHLMARLGYAGQTCQICGETPEIELHGCECKKISAWRAILSPRRAEGG